MSGFDKESFDAWVTGQAIPGMAEAARAVEITYSLLGLDSDMERFLLFSMGITTGLKLVEEVLVTGKEIGKSQFAVYTADAFGKALKDANKEGDEDVD